MQDMNKHTLHFLFCTVFLRSQTDKWNNPKFTLLSAPV